VVRRLIPLALCGLAIFAAPARGNPLLGINGNLPRFAALTGQRSQVHQAFLAWGQGQSFGSPFLSLFATLTPIPMIHLGTARQPPATSEALSPAQIGAGAGDPYLIGLNRAIAEWGKPIYVRPMAEMNNYENLYSGFRPDGSAKAGHSPAEYRKAFARISVILHGGSLRAMNATLRALGLPPLAHALPVNPFPRLRIVWSPLAGGNPRTPANAPEAYYPGVRFVDVEGGDIFEETPGDTAPWPQLEALYRNAVARGRPFSVPEWGIFTFDDETFVRHMCRFLESHRVTEEAAYYNSRPGSVLDLRPKPKSLQAYRECIVPRAGTVPGWATSRRGGAVDNLPRRPGVRFVVAGNLARGPASAPDGANEFEANFDPHTGVIASAFWIRDRKSLGPVPALPGQATGFVFLTKGSGDAPPLTPPAGATGIHVVWDLSRGVIEQAAWYRVGRLLAVTPVSSGQTALAMRGAG
jgi:hypothetical protein